MYTLKAILMTFFAATCLSAYNISTVTDKLQSTLDNQLFVERIATADTPFGQVILVGEEHEAPVFLTLKDWFTEEAIAGNVILFQEGLARNEQSERNYRISRGGTGDEPLYGLEAPTAQWVNVGILCRYKALGLVSSYAVPCKEAIINLSALESLGQKIWNDIAISQPANPRVAQLIQDLDPFIREIQSKSALQEKLDAFDNIAENLLPQIASYRDPLAWDGLYVLIARTAVNRDSDLSPELRGLVETLLGNAIDEQLIQSLQRWFSLNSTYRDTVYAQNLFSVLQLRASSTDQQPLIVLIVGANHLPGILEAVREMSNGS